MEKTKMNEMGKKGSTAIKLPLLKKIGYGFGECGSQFSWTLVSSYLSVFYTDVVGLTPVVISAIMLIARIWDAVNNPIFGSIAENTRSKWGRFRPYILFGSPILALFNCLCFLNLDISNTAKVLWCGITYIGCSMAYTVSNISVGCLANSLTSINTERVSLNAFRGGVGQIAGVIISAITMPIILFFGNNSTSSGRGYFMAALIFSIICIPCFLICFFSTEEVIGGAPKKENVVSNLINSFKLTFADHNAIFLILAMVCFLTGIMGRLGIMTYYFIYVLGDPVGVASFGTALSIGMVVANFYAPFLLNRIDKKWCGVITCVCQILGCAAFFFMGEARMSAASIAVVGFIYGCTNFGGLVANGLCAEIIDDNLIKKGRRADGVIYSCISFATKIGNAIGGSIGILALGAVGFVANTEMAPIVLTKMNAVINFGPCIFFVLSAICFAMIRMTNAKGKENEAIIAEKVVSKNLYNCE